jgi:hypothetical protein
LQYVGDRGVLKGCSVLNRRATKHGLGQLEAMLGLAEIVLHNVRLCKQVDGHEEVMFKRPWALDTYDETASIRFTGEVKRSRLQIRENLHEVIHELQLQSKFREDSAGNIIDHAYEV